MRDDALDIRLRQLEETPQVRSAFADALRDRLHAELGFALAAPAPAAVPMGRAVAPTDERRGGSARPGLLRRPRLRTALLIAAAILLLAGAMVAAAVVLRGWLSTGAHLLQYTDDFTIAEVYREQGAFYSHIVLGPDGDAAYAVREPFDASGDPDASVGAVVRFAMSGDSWQPPQVVRRLPDLRDPSLWDPAIDITPSTTAVTPAGGLAVAPDGTVFVALSASTSWGQEGSKTLGTTLVAVQLDGTVRKVATGGELAARAPASRPDALVYAITPAASSGGLLWVRAQLYAPGAADDWFRLFEIADPNQDGVWSDASIRSLVLPDTVPQMADGDWSRAYGPFVAEASVAGRDRSRSVLLPVVEDTGRYAVYRVADTDLDGDATDPGEAELVASASRSPGSVSRTLWQASTLAPRLVLDGGRVALDELVVAGLTREGRISRLTQHGPVDIVRALPAIADGVLATTDGAIYVVSRETTQEPGQSSAVETVIINRLTPVQAGEQPPIASSPQPSTGASLGVIAAIPTAEPCPPPGTAGPNAAATPSPSYEHCRANGQAIIPGSVTPPPAASPRPLTPGVPKLALWYAPNDGPNETVLLFGPDGGGPLDVLPGENVYTYCQSADGSITAFISDADVRGEPSLHLANADGSGRRTISETPEPSVWCGPWWEGDSGVVRLLPPGAILTYSDEVPHQIVRYDISTGARTELASGVKPLASSPDGRRLAMITYPDRKTLEVLDIATGAVTQIATAELGFVSAQFSPDGSRLAFVSGPFEPASCTATVGQVEVAVAELAAGTTRRLLAGRTQRPSIGWSSDGSALSVFTPTNSDNCYAARTFGDLQAIDVATGVATAVAADVLWGAWSPVDPNVIAFARLDAILVADRSGNARQVAAAAKTSMCPYCDYAPCPGWPAAWLGWSPDGRWIIALGDWVGAIDTTTGEVRLLTSEADIRGALMNARWWR